LILVNEIKLKEAIFNFMISHLKNSGSFWLTSFRPFFLLGSLYSIILIFLWLMLLSGKITFSIRASSIDWHAYEMVYGFLRAILVGFLFTAGQNWTGKIILRGNSLLALTSCWIFGRLSFHPNFEISALSSCFDILFDIVVVYLLYKFLYTESQIRNHIIVHCYFLFTFFHFLAGISILNLISTSYILHFVHLSIFVLILFLFIIAGRILPFFTIAQVPGATLSNFPILEKLLYPLCYSFIFSELLIVWFYSVKYVSAILGFTLFITNVIRLYRWKSWISWKYPILFVLHLGYLWLSIGFLAFGLYRLGYLPASPVYHIFTIGGLSLFIYGMITRIPLGHTGLKIKASLATQIAYLLLNVAFFIRVIFPLFHLTREAYFYSGILWIISFFLYLIQFTSILISPRIDGKIG